MLHELNASPETVHWGYYDAGVRPALKINSGDSVRLETVSLPLRYISSLKALGIQEPIPRRILRIFEEVKDRGPGAHVLTGPIFVKGAMPGDVLEIELQEIGLPLPFGFNLIRPGFGVLPEDYPIFKMNLIRLNRDEMIAEFSENVKIPLKPFFGSMGVAPPSSSGRISSRPPGFHGGNLDNKELIEGAKLFLPIHVEGALFSLGDGHAIQGDGEVNATGIETSLTGLINLKLRKDMKLRWPMGETQEHVISMGFHENIQGATKMAVRNMIDYLVANKNLDYASAYSLSSIAVDFHITQAVNLVTGVHGLLSKKMF
jgi:acetamidase/formamidase